MAELQKRGVQLVVEGQSAFFGDLDKANRAVNGFGDSTHKSAGRVSGASQIMTGALRHIGTIAIDVMAQAGRAVVGFVSDSIGAAGDFESGMNRFSAVAGGALDEAGLSIKDFRDQFIQIGKELPVSTAEVQEAAIEMVKGGIEPATIAAGGLKQVIQFAAAADLDLAEASTIAAKAIGGWVDQAASAQTKAEFLAHSTDLLAKAANASTVNVDDLALGLYNVQGTAKLAGVSFDETVTALAQLAPSFSSSSDAGTSFKTFLARLQPSTQPAIDAMNELGLVTFNAQKAMEALPTLNLDPSRQSVEEMMQAVFDLGISNGMTAKEANALVSSFNTSVFYDAQGNFVGMAEASRLLQNATSDLSEAQRIQALQAIFGQDAIRTAAVFAEQGATGFSNMTSALEKQNSVQEMAAQKQAGYNTALDNAKGSVEALQITIGSALLPVLTDLLNNVIAPGINVLTDLAGALSGDQEAFDRLTPPVREVANAITEVWNTGNALISWFQSAGDESSELGSVLVDLSGIWEKMLGVINAVMKGYEAIVNAVLPIVEGFIEEHGAEIDTFFQQTYDTIIDIINAALDLYKAIVPPTLEAIAKLIDMHGEEIGAFIEGAWKIISGIIDAALTLIKGVIQVTLALIKGDWDGAWTIVQETANRIWEDIKQIIEGAVQVIGAQIDTFIGLITGMPGQVSGVGEAVMNTIWDGMKAVWDDIVNWVNEQLAWFESQLPGSEPKDPSSPLRGLKQRGAAIMGNLMEGMQLGPSMMSTNMIAPPAITMPRPTVQLIQPANINNSTNTTNNYSPPRSDPGIPPDHLFVLFGGRG